MRKLGETEDKQITRYIEILIQTMHLIRCNYKILKRKKKICEVKKYDQI